ncbi:uncharacterized protein LOC119589014 isoform X2 [Penaeus monodon]|uniref:uncharacterized protein LOC119589014 isoform X2 n=1 Tax=Penaeus monodon TaxID=6687 RepID=UPI0018A6F53C|nr:uncharacterized protein LOC119589014 isoform X2 [Penaeus monodon]
MSWPRALVAVALVTVAAAAPSNSTKQIEKPGWQPRLLGQKQHVHGAFMELYFSEDDTLDYTDRWNLYISSFDPFGEVDVEYRMKSPGRFLDDIASWNIQVMDETAVWPNNPDYLPSSVAGAEGIIWTSGFLMPGKTDGQLQMYDTTKDPAEGPYNIASNDDGKWAYHRVIWKDMDLDGDLDALTARFHRPLIGTTQHDLLWFENEGTGFSEGWKEHLIASDGPDIHFDMVTLSAGGRDYNCIIAGEFFSERISIYWTESEVDDWSDPTLVKSRIINSDVQPFDVLVEDFNRDGVLEFLVTEFRNDLGIGHVSVYQFPEDFRTDDFPHFKIADGFLPNQVTGGQTMSPGTPKVYYPNAAYAEDVAEDGMPHKPYILLSGDDDGRFYVLYPTSEDRNDWVYEKNVLIDTEDIMVGKMAHGDLDGDGYEEIVVAGYAVNQLFVFTYAP